jgi:hypothetical protein
MLPTIKFVNCTCVKCCKSELVFVSSRLSHTLGLYMLIGCIKFNCIYCQQISFQQGTYTYYSNMTISISCKRSTENK